MFGQFTGEEQPDGGLDLPGGDGGTLVVVGKTRSLTSDSLKDIVDEGVHDAHGLGGDAGVGVDLLQDLVHVDGVALLPGLPALLASLDGGLGDGFLGALLGRGLRWLRHDDDVSLLQERMTRRRCSALYEGSAMQIRRLQT